MIKRILLLGCIATMIACTPTKQSTIDTTLQTKVDSILHNKMSENRCKLCYGSSDRQD